MECLIEQPGVKNKSQLTALLGNKENTQLTLLTVRESILNHVSLRELM